MKFSKTPRKKQSGEGSTTSAGSAAPCRSAGLSSPTAVNPAADGGEDQRGRPAEHQRTASGGQRAKDAVAGRQHDIAVAERCEGDEREVKGVVIGFEGAEEYEEPGPQSHLCEMTEEQRDHCAERDPERPADLARLARAAIEKADAGEHNRLCQDLHRDRAAHRKEDRGQPAHPPLPKRTSPATRRAHAGG